LITTTKRYYKKSTIENIDESIYNWFTKTLDIRVIDKAGKKQKVEVIFGAGEKFAQIKNRGKRIRDKNNALILPLISIRRVGFSQVQDMWGLARFQKYLNYTKVLNPETSNRANLFRDRRMNGHITKAEVPVYEMIQIPYPKFIKVNYAIQFWTQYMIDMNAILEYVWTSRNEQSSENNWISVEGGGNKYLIVTDPETEDASNLEDFSGEERLIRSTMNFKILGYLLGDTDQVSQKSEPCVSHIEIKDEVVISDPKEIARIFLGK
jgi:hypothetical protein